MMEGALMSRCLAQVWRQGACLSSLGLSCFANENVTPKVICSGTKMKGYLRGKKTTIHFDFILWYQMFRTKTPKSPSEKNKKIKKKNVDKGFDGLLGGGWTNPIEKYDLQKLESSPRDENKKNVWNDHLVSDEISLQGSEVWRLWLVSQLPPLEA